MAEIFPLILILQLCISIAEDQLDLSRGHMNFMCRCVGIGKRPTTPKYSSKRFIVYNTFAYIYAAQCAVFSFVRFTHNSEHRREKNGTVNTHIYARTHIHAAVDSNIQCIAWAWEGMRIRVKSVFLPFYIVHSTKMALCACAQSTSIQWSLLPNWEYNFLFVFTLIVHTNHMGSLKYRQAKRNKQKKTLYTRASGVAYIVPLTQ